MKPAPQQGTLGEVLVSATPLASLAPRSSLTADHVRVLERVGSFVDTMPAAAHKASTFTRLRGAELFTQSLVSSEVATLLGVSESRVRQRVSNRSLYAIKSKSSTRFPRFQFTDDGELPGWDVVAPRIPVDAHPLAAQNVIVAVNEELELAGELVSPYEWLAAAGDPSEVVEIIEAAFALNT